MRDLAVVIVAAGKGERLGAGVPKAFVSLAGKPLLAHALERVAQVDRLSQVVIAAPDGFQDQVRKLAGVLPTQVSFNVVAGGSSRQQSISNALVLVEDSLELVLIHDSARALASARMIERVAETVRTHKSAVVPTMPVIDTIKRIKEQHVLETIDRSVLAIAQTPQGFETAKLKNAYANASAEYTDDAALYQAAGGSIIHVEGEADAFKITTAADLANAQRLMTSRSLTGIGTDTHRFATEGSRNLMLACIEWPGETALEGHSDGDAVAHAVVDALLSAAGMGDIGSNFGVDRPEFSGAAGEVFVRATVDKLLAAGFSIQNVAVQVIANRPKIGPRRELAEARMTELVGAPVTIGATTTDGLGFLGNSEGLAAVATALIAAPENRDPKDRVES